MGIDKKREINKIRIKHNKKLFWLMILVAVMLILVLKQISSLTEINGKIEKEVYDILEENEKVPVAIKLKDGAIRTGLKTHDSELHKEDFKEEIIMISKKELKELEKNNDIAEISYAPQIRAMLSDSVPLINATSVWPIQLNNINITGFDETVCVIDSGIDFTHSDLIGKNKTCIIVCF